MTDPHATPRTPRRAPIRQPLTLGLLLEHATDPLPDTGCRLWTGSVTSAGYGNIWINRRQVSPHRLVAALSYGWTVEEFLSGVMPRRLETRHTCGRKRCLEPSHLLVGTHTDNARDRSLHRVGFRYTYVEAGRAA